jgi:predicted phage terminase large subunit-like protein
VFLLDLWRAQVSSDKWVEALCNMISLWRPVGWAEEKGQIKSGVGPFLVKRLRERRLYIARAQFPTRGDKAVRAQSIRGRMAMDGLYVPVHAPWFPAFRHELMSFPAGKNDDQVDAIGLIGQVLDKMISGRAVSPEAEKPKMISTDPKLCTVTLDDLFEANEHRGKYHVARIH